MTRVSYGLLAAVVMVLCMGGAAQAAILLQDNFDSYADQTAFNAAWSSVGTSGPVTLTTSPVSSGPNSVTGGTTGSFRSNRSFAETTPSVTQDLEISFKINVASTTQGRQFIDLTDGAANASGMLLELGVYNSPASSEWFVRMLGSTEANAFIPVDAVAANRAANQWFELKALIHRETSTTASGQIFVNNVLAKTLTGFTLRSYDTVRIGSNITSAINVSFDDVLVQTVPVPEPASLGLAAVAGLGLLRRRRA